MSLEEISISRLRLDRWLDLACLFRTRSEAQKSCRGGKIEVNGQRVKAHREIEIGDQIVITRPMGRRQHIIIRQLVEQHVPKNQAQRLYEDLTPPPSAREISFRQMERLSRPMPQTGTPSKRARRELRRLKRF